MVSTQSIKSAITITEINLRLGISFLGDPFDCPLLMLLS